MNALYVLSLVVAVANAHYYNGFLPYSHNLLHTTAFSSPVASPLQYTVAAPHPFRYKVAAAAPASVKYTVAAAPAPLTFAAPAPVSYTTAAVAPAVVVPTTRTSQYHAQDEFGQYSFGYSGGPSSRNEVRDAFGVVRGSYNYVDANGEIQTQSYIADSNGFRVAATNLPVAPEATLVAGPEPVMDTAEVKAAKTEFQALFKKAADAAAAAPDTRRKRSTIAQYYNGLLPYSHNLLHTTAFSSPVASPLQYTVAAPHPFRYNLAAAAPASVKYTVAAAPAPLTFAAPSPVAYTTAAVAPAVVIPTTRTSQYHAQDEFGQYSFGYSGGPSSRNEVRDAFGVVRGSYNYVDANGEIQTQTYIADSNGFRVAATNLPVAPETADAPFVAGPEPVMDTAEVKAAKTEFQALFKKAAAAAAAAPDTRRKRSTDLVAPMPVQDTAEVVQAKAEFQALFDAAAAAAEAAPDVGPLEGPFNNAYYGSYAPFRYNGLTPYTGLPFNYGPALPYNGAFAYHQNAYPYNFAHTW